MFTKNSEKFISLLFYRDLYAHYNASVKERKTLFT